MNRICICHESEKHGQTSVMCCNKCGLPDEDFWKPPSEADQDELWRDVSEDIGICYSDPIGSHSNLMQELKSKYHLTPKQ